VRRRRSASRSDRLAYVIKVTSMALEGLGVPKYSSEYSKKMYDDHLKIGLLVLKQYLHVSFRELCSMMPSIKIWKGRVPDHSTLVKFSLRLDANVMDRVLWAVAHMLCGEGLTAAVDSTGFSFSNASRHFVKRLRELGNGADTADSTRKRFAKVSLAVDTDTKMILACDCVDSRHADVKRVSFLVDDLVDGEFGVKYVVADKGYDAEYVHVGIMERLNAGSFIPIRKIEPARIESTRVTTKGFNRGRMKFFFDKEVYNKRSQAETVNSMVKRKMGDTVNGRTEESRHKEILFRCIAHNIRRLMDVKHPLRQ
jgi:transposase